MNSLRDDVQKELGYLIPENGWRQKFAEMQNSGKIGDKQRDQLIILLLEHVERLESKD